jgi:hypothetical protein
MALYKVKSINQVFKNWSEGVIVEAWEQDSYDLSEAMKGQY